MRILIVNNGSLYNNHLISFLTMQKSNFSVLPYFKALDFVDKFDSFILTGRQHNNKLMNVINTKIIYHSISHNKFLFGICYGTEIMALALGGTIVKMNSIKYGPTNIEIIKSNPICNGANNIFKNHRYKISKAGKSIFCLARSEDCFYEMIQYSNSNIFGTQFHPEMTSDGLNILKSFISL